jgi:DnaJ-class molecular chaperone
LLYEEHDKVVEVEKSLALEVKKNERLVCYLSSCHSTISSLKVTNGDLNAKIDKLNDSSSSLEHVSICTKCKDHDFDACINHVSTIAKLNDEIVQLNVQLKTCKNEVKKLNLLGMPSSLVDIHPLRTDLVSKREPRTQKT